MILCSIEMAILSGPSQGRERNRLHGGVSVTGDNDKVREERPIGVALDI